MQSQKRHNNAAHTLITCMSMLAWLRQSCALEILAAWGQRKLTFTFDKLRIRLGPKWLDFPLKAGQLGTTCGLPCALLPSTELLLRQNAVCMHVAMLRPWFPCADRSWSCLVTQRPPGQGEHGRQEVPVLLVHICG